jgi:hypothetical protein
VWCKSNLPFGPHVLVAVEIKPHKNSKSKTTTHDNKNENHEKEIHLTFYVRKRFNSERFRERRASTPEAFASRAL